MAKLIPGKLRMEGVTLYETGNIKIIKEKGIASILVWREKTCATV